MKSVIGLLGSDEFIHIRIGTGQPIYKNDLINYVIGKLSKEEYELLTRGIEIGVEAVVTTIEKGIDNAMNIINIKN